MVDKKSQMENTDKKGVGTKEVVGPSKKDTIVCVGYFIFFILGVIGVFISSDDIVVSLANWTILGGVIIVILDKLFFKIFKID